MPSLSSLPDNRRTSLKLSSKGSALAQQGLAKLIGLFQNVSQTCVVAQRLQDIRPSSVLARFFYIYIYQPPPSAVAPFLVKWRISQSGKGLVINLAWPGLFSEKYMQKYRRGKNRRRGFQMQKAEWNAPSPHIN